MQGRPAVQERGHSVPLLKSRFSCAARHVRCELTAYACRSGKLSQPETNLC